MHRRRRTLAMRRTGVNPRDVLLTSSNTDGIKWHADSANTSDEAFTVCDNPVTSLDQLIGANDDRSQVPDTQIDLRQYDSSYSSNSSDDEQPSQRHQRKKVKFTDSLVDDDVAPSDDDRLADLGCPLLADSYFVPYDADQDHLDVTSSDSVTTTTSASSVFCSELLSQSSDLESFTIENLLAAGQLECEDSEGGRATPRPSPPECDQLPDTAAGTRSATQISLTGLPYRTLSSSVDSLNTEYDGDIDVDHLVNLPSLELGYHRHLTNPLLQQTYDDDALLTSPDVNGNLIVVNSRSRAEGQDILELTSGSLDSLSLYSPSSGRSVASSSQPTNSQQSSDQLVPTSSEDEISQRLERDSRRRRLQSCNAQVVPDSIYSFIEE